MSYVSRNGFQNEKRTKKAHALGVDTGALVMSLNLDIFKVRDYLIFRFSYTANNNLFYYGNYWDLRRDIIKFWLDKFMISKFGQGYSELNRKERRRKRKRMT